MYCLEKKRSPNFSPGEKTLLLTLTYQRRHIIENKRTDKVSNIAKQKCWDEIATIFNSKTPEHVTRTADCLHKMYNNKKKESRRWLARRKAERAAGFTAPERVRDEHLKLVLAATSDETDLWEDCDQDESIPEIETNESPVLKVRKMGELVPHLPKMDESDTLISFPSTDDDTSHMMEPEIEPKPETLSTTEEKHEIPAINFLQSQRYPSSYSDELLERKLELIEKHIYLQLKDEERKSREEKRKEEKFVLEKKSLELDVAIKSVYLEKLQKCKSLSEVGPVFTSR